MNNSLGVGHPGSAGPGWRLRASLAAALALSALASLPGCSETDAWMWDSSRVGRWERTPTTTPILRRIASIEGPADEFVEVSEPAPEDLIPEVVEYRIAPGDVLNIVIWNLPNEGDSTPYQRQVDARGTIMLPQLGQLRVSGETVEGAKSVIGESMKAKDLVAEPVVDMAIQSQRELRFNVLGAVYNPGPYVLDRADFRLLEALAAAGGATQDVPPASTSVYVIRQIPLEERVRGRVNRGAGPAPEQPAQPGGEGLVDIINRLATPPEARPQEPPPAPPPEKPGDRPSPGVLRPRQPPIDLVPAQPAQPPKPELTPPPEGDAPWVFLNGQWVRARQAAPIREPGAPSAEGLTAEQLVTQRVIRVALDRLMGGDARYNIVIRPGDVIWVPRESAGIVFIGGEVARAGTYSMSDHLTLTAAIVAAGGLSAVAIPERVDLTRHVGNDRLATIRLNLRAIYERTHPDIYLRPNDQINVGTNFWAYPLAVIRNGFRATYGFGFLLDRNFGADVFGPEPLDQRF